MTSKNEELTGKNKRSLLLGILIVVVLILALILWLESASHPSANSSASAPTFQINLPTVQYPTIPPSAPDYKVEIHSLDNSGITGSATFQDIAGTVAILLEVKGLPGGEENEESIMPAEIHVGTCSAPGELAYPMSAPDAGQSETDLSINLKQFNAQKPMALILYRSTEDHTAVACGDIS